MIGLAPVHPDYSIAAEVDQLTPEFPILAVNDRGAVIGHEGADDLGRCSLVGLCQGKYERMRYYDAKGVLWSASVVKAPFKASIWTKILGQIYNPWFTVDLGWKDERTYEFPELQDDICMCVDMDDDILTQFIEADKLKKLIREASNFHHLFNRMKKMKLVCR